MSDGLIQGRACGACTVCCKDLTIQSPELSKLPGFLCTHCVEGRGCQIYDQRPSVCRAWYCAWRSIAALDETWRPDRSGVLIEYTQEAQKTGLKITLLRDEAETAWHALADLVSHLVAQDVPAFLVVPGPPGFHRRQGAAQRCDQRRDRPPGAALSANCNACAPPAPPIPTRR
ncbi:MAG: hypothetical protein WDN76_02880 [Alphaproteobacteria bacterium]